MGSVKLSGRDVTVKTLTVAQVRETLDELKPKKGEKEKSVFDIDIVDLLFDDDVPAVAVSKSTGLTLKELGGPHDPREVRELIDEVRAQNPFFVAMMERIVRAGKAGSGGKAAEPSSPPSAA